jgi:HEAT repeat protein
LVEDCLFDENEEVRREAVIALLRIGSPEARQALEGALADEDFEVRLYAEEALKRLPVG